MFLLRLHETVTFQSESSAFHAGQFGFQENPAVADPVGTLGDHKRMIHVQGRVSLPRGHPHRVASQPFSVSDKPSAGGQDHSERSGFLNVHTGLSVAG